MTTKLHHMQLNIISHIQYMDASYLSQTSFFYTILRQSLLSLLPISFFSFFLFCNRNTITCRFLCGCSLTDSYVIDSITHVSVSLWSTYLDTHLLTHSPKSMTRSLIRIRHQNLARVQSVSSLAAMVSSRFLGDPTYIKY